MNRVAFKFFRFASFTLGSIGLVALSSPWILSHPTCLKFACSLVSAKIGKRIECSGFQWQPFGKTEISSLSLSDGLGQHETNLSIGHLTIDDPFLVVLDYIKGEPLHEILRDHVEIDSVHLKVNQLTVLELSPQKERNSDQHSFIMTLYAKNLKPLVLETLLIQDQSKESPLGALIDHFHEKLPEYFEIPFTLDYNPTKIDLSFTSPQFHGSASLLVGHDLVLDSQLTSLLIPSYRFDLTGMMSKINDQLHLDASIVSDRSDGNTLFVTFDDAALKTKIHLSQLDLFLPLGHQAVWMIPHQLDAEGMISFSEKKSFSFDFTSDLGRGHFLGENSPSAWVLQEGELHLNVEQAKSCIHGSLGDFITPKSLSMKLGPVTLSKRKSKVENAEVLLVINADFPKFEAEAADTLIHATCKDNSWDTTIESIFSAEPAHFVLDHDSSAFYVNLLKPIDFASTTVQRVLAGLLVNDLVVEDLKVNALSVKIPVHGETFPFSDLKTEWEVKELKVKTHGSEFSTGLLQVDAYCPGDLQDWNASFISGDDRFTVQYTNQRKELSTGTLEIEKLPLGKWLSSSVHFSDFRPDFKIDAEVQRTSRDAVSFKVKGSSPIDQLALVGSYEPSKLMIDQALYESVSQDPKSLRKIKVTNLSYLPLEKELFIEEGILEDRIDKKSKILGKARSTDLGLEVDLHILDGEGHSKFHMEALTKSILNPQKLALDKIEIQADHCPLSMLTERGVPFSHELRDILGDEFTCSLQLENGNLKSRFRSTKWMFSFSGRFENDFFVSTKPFFAQVDLDPVALNQLAKWIPSANKYKFTHPLNLRIDENSIKIPVADFQLSQISAKGSLELGQFTAPSPSFGRPLLKLLKQKDAYDLVSLWTTPVNFQIDQGKIAIERVDFLVQDKIHLAFWGNGELYSTQMNYNLGIAQDTLGELFGLQELPHDFLLSLPLRYKKNKVDLDLKESLKSIEQFLLLQGAVSGALPSWLDQFLQLGKHSVLPYPPLQYKLPWAVAREEVVQKKLKNKLKPKIAEQGAPKPQESAKPQETTKSQEKTSTVEKAKEWVELFKIFKVLN